MTPGLAGRVPRRQGCDEDGREMTGDGVIHETGDTEATSGTPESNRENAAIDPLIDFRSSPRSRHSRDRA